MDLTNQDFIFCRNCGRKSYFDHYGFCSLYCFSDFSVKSGILEQELKDKYLIVESEQFKEKVLSYKNEIEELKDRIISIEQNLYHTECDKKRKEEQIELLRKNIETLKNSNSELDKTIFTFNSSLKKLEEENKKLRNRFSRFDIMEVEG